MKKILFIGCGGSGGMTLRYLMDQVSADLQAAGAPGRVPLSWQFLHIDAPTQEEDLGRGGFRTVTEYNEGSRNVGAYASMGTSLNYENAVATLMERLSRYAKSTGSENVKNMATDLASWQPNNSNDMRNLNSASLTDGAGEFRMIGRVLFLNALDNIVEAIRDAHGRLQTNAAKDDADLIVKHLPELNSDPNNEDAEKVMVFIFGSMAGGSGASMLIDVARAVQAAIPHNDTVLYGYAPEIFKNLSIGVTPGHTGNALAMASEISSLLVTQDSKANKLDAELYQALGHSTRSNEATFQRFFPIGLSQGASSTISHKDADPATIYRRLGRGIARLVLSSQAFDTFIRYTLGNASGGGSVVQVDHELMNWGASSPAAAWSGFGYASLAMGRDRFREYAAQRLARQSVDTLTEGHIDPTSTDPGKVQVQNLVENTFDQFLENLKLPQPDGGVTLGQGAQVAAGSVTSWVAEEFGNIWDQHLKADMTARYQQLIPEHSAADDSVENVKNWLAQLKNVQSTQRREFENLEQQIDAGVRRTLTTSMDELVDRTLLTIEERIASHGLEYATWMLETIRQNYLRLLCENLANLGDVNHQTSQITAPLERIYVAIEQSLEGQSKRAKTVADLGQRVSETKQRQVEVGLRNYTLHTTARILDRVLVDYADNFLIPLQRDIADKLSLLNDAKQITNAPSGVELYNTDVYRQWPHDGKVPERFKAAHNEVLITEPETFPEDYDNCLLAQYPTDRKISADGAQRRFTEAIITGRWESVGGKRSPAEEPTPTNLIVSDQRWIADALADRANGEIATPARFKIHSSTRNVVDRALHYLDRPNEAFDQFISQDIRSYGADNTVGEAELVKRQDEMARKFLETASMAQPMVSVSSEIAQALHPDVDKIMRTLTFATVPFANQNAGRKVYENLQRQSDLAGTSLAQFQRQMEESDSGSGIRRVDVFGSFQNYMPVVYSSLFKPIYEYWNSTAANRKQFTYGRRTRSLGGFVPISDAERHALITGWMLGRALGLVNYADERNPTAPEVYDVQNSRWERFPWPLYTPPQEFKPDFFPDSWLPAVLESIPLAWLSWYSTDTNVLTDRDKHPMRAYQVLRKIYDDAQAPTQKGSFVHAQGLLEDLLRDGVSPLGPVTLVEGITDQEERFKQLEEALHMTIEDYESLFLTPGQDFQLVSRLDHIYQTPLTADIAQDIVEACQHIIELAQEALAKLQDAGGPLPGRKRAGRGLV